MPLGSCESCFVQNSWNNRF